MRNINLVFLLLSLGLAAPSDAEDVPLSELGRQEILLGLKGARPSWSRDAFTNLPAVWGLPVEPNGPEFRSELARRYGLFYDAELSVDNLPVGLVETSAPILTAGGYKTGITVSCLICHSQTLLGRGTPGVGNVFLDMERFYADLRVASGGARRVFFESNPPGNSMVSYSNYMGRLGIFTRQPFPAVNLSRLYAVFADPNPNNAVVNELQVEQPFRELVKTQSWLSYRYKVANDVGFYVDGGYKGSPAATHYALHFTLDPFGSDVGIAIQRFDRVVPAYLTSLEAPRFPRFDSLDQESVTRGKNVYDRRCAACHGTFAAESNTNRFALVSYPGRSVDPTDLMTDPLRIEYRINYDDEVPDYIRAQYRKTGRYVAPALVGIWSRAPYLHNASVPTLAQLLDSTTRITRYGIKPMPESPDNFDFDKVGWLPQDLSGFDDAALAVLRRNEPNLRIYDPSAHLGMSNAGHTYGDSLLLHERRDLLEFLKAL